MKARILLACAQQAHRRTLAILPGHELSFVGTSNDAEAALKANGYDLIMIGIHFDESRAFDLLRYEGRRGLSEGAGDLFSRHQIHGTADKSLLRRVEMACKEIRAA